MTNRNEHTELTWIRDLGSNVSTYHAKADVWSYTVDQPRKGQWVLRGWGPAGQFLYRPGHTTMKSAKAAAEDHLADQQAKGAQVREAAARAGENLVKVTDALAEVAPTAADAAASMARAVALVQAARDRVQFRKDTCGCRTPLHTMRCGVGGHVRVVRP